MTPGNVFKFVVVLVMIVAVLWFLPDPQGATIFQRLFMASSAIVVAAVVGAVVWARGRGCLVVTWTAHRSTAVRPLNPRAIFARIGPLLLYGNGTFRKLATNA